MRAARDGIGRADRTVIVGAAARRLQQRPYRQLADGALVLEDFQLRGQPVLAGVRTELDPSVDAVRDLDDATSAVLGRTIGRRGISQNEGHVNDAGKGMVAGVGAGGATLS